MSWIFPPNWKIHPIFHISNLQRYVCSKEFSREEKPPPPIMVDDKEKYEVEAILRHKGKGARCLYQVLWKGYPITKASWELESHLCNASSLLENYLRRVAETEWKQAWKKRSKWDKCGCGQGVTISRSLDLVGWVWLVMESCLSWE